MTTAEQNYRLLQEIEANRRFLLMAYQQNPELLERAEARIKQIFAPPPLRDADEASSTGISRQRGFSLIEIIMFIVIISTALAGILLVSNKVSGHSADALIHKQSLAIAESLLEEVSLRYFTYCDPDDANASTAEVAAVAANGCAATVEAIGAETIGAVTENRYSGIPVNTQFDNVSDYNGFNMPAGGGIKDIANATIAGLDNYGASVTVAPVALGNITLASGNALLITVTVTGPDGQQVVLDGYRARYAPNLF